MASAGVPGLFPVAADAYEVENPDYASAVVLDSARQRWIVRSPETLEASVRLESEHVILHSFTPGLRARLPFQLPTVVGSADRAGLRTFVYPAVPGDCVGIQELVRRSRVVSPDRDPLTTQLGHALAVIHTLPIELVREADLPTYSAEQCRQRMLAELDRAAGTGRISSPLLRRWESRLEDHSLWQFRPTVVHGDLSEENLVVDGTRLSAVRGWHDTHVGDPATDFSWLISCPDQDFADAVVEVYSVQLPHSPDRHLLRRAYLYAEFALAQWLVRALEEGDPAVVREAQDMLDALEADLRASGTLDHPAPGTRTGATAAGPSSMAGEAGATDPAPGATPSAEAPPSGAPSSDVAPADPTPASAPQDRAVHPGA